MAVTEQLTQEGWMLFILSVVIAAVVVAVAVRRPGARRMGDWADRYDLPLTDANRPLVTRYLRRTRSFRAIGGAIGWLISMTWVAVTRRPFPLGGDALALAIAGYLLGAVAAEATFLRPPQRRAGPRTASLIPRELGDYVGSFAVQALRLLPLATVGLAVVYAVVPKDPLRTVDPSVAFVVVVSAALVVFSVALEAILRSIVARAQPAEDEALVTADDAIRSASIHALSGAGIGMLLVGVGWATVSVGTVASSELLQSMLPWFGVLAFAGGVAGWIVLGHPSRWRVRHDAGAGAGSTR
ncbi:MAG TPA: hypothetical protein VNN79_03075 [Actinomycetota bacterium]|nr:hypothetical protein [Actinomycetota bacterium]